jgi:hypothetical protein
MKIDRPN